MARALGRPPHPRNVYSFEDPVLVVPTELVLDTSFVVRALVSTELHHEACQAFMVRLAEADSLIYYNKLLEIELAEAAFKIAVVEQHGKKAWPRKRNDGRVRRRAGRLQRDLIESWYDLLTTVPHICVALDEVAGEVPGLMAQFGLASMDATHVATANFVDATGLVATDAGFASVPANQLRLYVDDTRVRSCRRRRGGR